MMAWSLNEDGISLHGSSESRLTRGRTLVREKCWGLGHGNKSRHSFDSDFYSFHYQICTWILIFKTTLCLYMFSFSLTQGEYTVGTPIFVVSIATFPPKITRILTSNGVCKINILFFSSDFYSVLKMKQERPKLCVAHSLMLKAPRQGKTRGYH